VVNDLRARQFRADDLRGVGQRPELQLRDLNVTLFRER
jgi:hypothetical protein